MQRNTNKDSVAVLLHVPADIYDKYLETLQERYFKRQAYSTKLFVKAIEAEIEEFNKTKIV